MQTKITGKQADELIEKMGLKKSFVAGKIGVNPGTLSRFLTGKGPLGRSALILLCQVLEIKSEAS